MAPPPSKRKFDSDDDTEVLPETKRYQREDEYLKSIVAKYAHNHSSADKESVYMQSNEAANSESSKIEQLLMLAQAASEDVAQQPEQQKQHEHDATKKAEIAAMPAMRLTDTSRLSKTMSAVRQLDEASKESAEQHKESKEQQKELKKHHEELKEQVIEMKQQQDDAIKKAVEKAFTEEVAKAVKNAIALQLPDAVKHAVAKQLPEELKKVVAEQLPREVEKVIVEQLPKEVKRVQEAMEKKANKAVEEAIAKNDTALEHLKDEFEKIQKNADEKLDELRTQLQQSKDSLKKYKKKYKKRGDKLATLAEEYETTIAEVKEAAEQAANSTKEADAKLQQALDEKTEAESAIASLLEVIESHSNLPEQHQDQFERMNHQSSVESQDLMELDGAAYPSPNSEGAPQTPNSWSQSQTSTSRFTGSTSSTTNDGSALGRKPRQALMFISGRNANPFADPTPRKVIDTENIAMENHSRFGMSSDLPSSDESDEEVPRSNAPGSQDRQFQSSAELATGSFGRPSAGHLGTVNGAGQSNPHHAPYIAPVSSNYSQQHANYPSGAEQPHSRRAPPPSRTQDAHTAERMIPPPYNTPGPSQAQINYNRQKHQQHHQHQRENDNLYGAEQSNLRHATQPSRKRGHFDGNVVSGRFREGSSEDEQDLRDLKRVRFENKSNFSHPESQLPTQGRGGGGGGSGRGGNTQGDLVPLNGASQTPSSYVASSSHHQDRHMQRGKAASNKAVQPHSSYEEWPQHNHGGYAPTGPPRGYDTAQPPSFQEQSPLEETDYYAAKRDVNAKLRMAVEQSRREPQSQIQSQPQQPQHNGKHNTNKNGRAHNRDAEPPRDRQNDNPRYAPSPEPQSHRSFSHATHANSSRLQEPESEGVMRSIEDEGEEEMRRDEQHFSEKISRKKPSSMAQHGAQQTNTPRTPAPKPQSFRGSMGLSLKAIFEGCDEIIAADAAARSSSKSNKGQRAKHLSQEQQKAQLDAELEDYMRPADPAQGLSQDSANSTGGDLASEDDESSTPHSFNGKKNPSKKSANPTGGDMFSRVTYPHPKDDGSSTPHPSHRKRGPSQMSANPTGGDNPPFIHPSRRPRQG